MLSAVVFAIGAMVPPLLCAGPNFTEGRCDLPVMEGRQFTLSRYFSGFTTSDQNGDGLLDVVFGAGGASPGVVVAFTNTRGKTPKERFSPSTLWPEVLFAAKLNGDDFDDLVIARLQGRVSVLEGLGEGAFAPIQELILSPGYYDLAIGDLDGDGFDDLCGVTTEDDAVFVHVSTGTGTFHPRVAVPWPHRAFKVRILDMDGDGDRDLVGIKNTEDNRLTTIVFNNGAGEFGSFSTIDVSVWEFGDMNADTLPDLITTVNYPHALHILRNMGNGTFGAMSSLPMNSFPNRLAIDDVDGDGLDDVLMAADYGGQAVLYRNAGDGVLEYSDEFAVGRWLDQLELRDIDGKNGPDIVGSADGTEWLVHFNDGHGRFRPYSVASLGSLSCEVMTSIDANGDDLQDFVCAAGQVDRASILVNRGNRLFDRQSLSVADLPAGLVSMDLNNDQHDDVLISTRHTLDVLTNNGQGHFERTASLPLFPEGASRPGPMSVGDVDDDGDLDVVVADLGTVSVHILKNDGNGGLARTSIVIGTSIIDAALVDVNADTRLDIVVAATDGALLRVLTNLGNGEFSPPASTLAPHIVAPQDMATADLDADGRVDIVVATTNGASVFRNDGTALFAQSHVVDPGTRPDGLFLGDVDDDGRPDIVTLEPFSNEVRVMRNLGNMQWCGPSCYIAGRYPIAGVVGDVDGDGRNEVSVSAYSQCSVVSLIRTPSAAPEFCPADIDGSLDVSVADFSILAAHFGEAVTPNTLGDLNGDGMVNFADFTIFAPAFGRTCP